MAKNTKTTSRKVVRTGPLTEVKDALLKAYVENSHRLPRPDVLAYDEGFEALVQKVCEGKVASNVSWREAYAHACRLVSGARKSDPEFRAALAVLKPVDKPTTKQVNPAVAKAKAAKASKPRAKAKTKTPKPAKAAKSAKTPKVKAKKSSTAKAAALVSGKARKRKAVTA